MIPIVFCLVKGEAGPLAYVCDPRNENDDVLCVQNEVSNDELVLGSV